MLLNRLPYLGAPQIRLNTAKFVAGPRAVFADKRATASLNLSTFAALYDYGYENVYELGPQLDPEKSKLSFEPAIEKK